MAVQDMKLLNIYWQSEQIDKLLQVPVIIRFHNNIIGLQGSWVKHMVSMAQATYCGEIY